VKSVAKTETIMETFKTIKRIVFKGKIKKDKKIVEENPQGFSGIIIIILLDLLFALKTILSNIKEEKFDDTDEAYEMNLKAANVEQKKFKIAKVPSIVMENVTPTSTPLAENPKIIINKKNSVIEEDAKLISVPGFSLYTLFILLIIFTNINIP
jgi:hypothetical protein